MNRRLFNFAAALSLLLCLATLALWVRSYFTADVVHDNRVPRSYFSISSWRGLVIWDYELIGSLSLEHSGTAQTQPDHGWNWFVNPPGPIEAPGDTDFGFSFLQDANSKLGWRYISGSFPHWFLALLFAVLPALYIRTLIRSRKHRHAGLCPVCGYDLRATRERCPECGKDVLATDEHR